MKNRAEIEEVISSLRGIEDRFNKCTNSKAKKPPAFVVEEYYDAWTIRQAIGFLQDHLQILAEKDAVVQFLSSALEEPMKRLIRENAEPKRDFDDY